jgi:hypothetical protein
LSKPILGKLTPIKDSVISMSQSSSYTNSTDKDIEHNRLAQLAQQYLNNPMLMYQLCDRVYERLHADIKIQKERIGNSNTGRK